jgi:hypothetical protein
MYNKLNKITKHLRWREGSRLSNICLSVTLYRLRILKATKLSIIFKQKNACRFASSCIKRRIHLHTSYMSLLHYYNGLVYNNSTSLQLSTYIHFLHDI